MQNTLVYVASKSVIAIPKIARFGTESNAVEIKSTKSSFYFQNSTRHLRMIMTQSTTSWMSWRKKMTRRTTGTTGLSESQVSFVELINLFSVIVGMQPMNSMKLVIPLHSLYWSIHTKDESKCETTFAFIFGVN